MAKSHILLALAASAVSAAPLAASAPQYTFDQIPATKNLTWYNCYNTFQCARLNVPLDYTSTGSLRAYVPLIKIPAAIASTDPNYKGMVLFNPGGPGSSGVDTILSAGSLIQGVTGANYDLVSFDPRGVGRAIPSGNCLSNYTVSRAQSPLYKRYPVASNEADVFLTDSYTQGAEIAAVCGPLVGGVNQAGPYMTSAVNARDMLSIVDAFQLASGKSGQGLLNYWGASYGSYIGQTFASIYPTRVGRMVLDGVINAPDWSSASDNDLVIHTDDAVNTFFDDCYAGGSACTFNQGGSASAGDIQTRMQNIFNRLNATQAYAKGWANASTIEYALVNLKGIMMSSAYYPLQEFPLLAQQLVSYEAVLSNLTKTAVDAIVAPSASSIVPENTIEILCSDQAKPAPITPATLARFRKQSVYGGEYVINKIAICSVWPITAKMRFAGPFGGSPKNPILFVSNTVDPITPIENGIAMSALYKGSQFLTIQGEGHTSFSRYNACAFGHIGAYFQTGSMSSATATCASSRTAFDGKGSQIL